MTDTEFVLLVLFYVAVGTVPTVIIAYLFGGRGLVLVWVLVAVAAAWYLVWFFGFRGRSDWTGMEGISLVLLPAAVAGLGLLFAICYGVFRAAGLLPRQRS